MIRFFVVGTPTPQGSKKPVPVKTKGGGTRTVLIEDNDARKKTWRGDVEEAVTRWKEEVLTRLDRPLYLPLDGALVLDVVFYFDRPASISAKKRPYPNVKPDVDKVSRSIMDCLKINGLITDDARVVDLFARKRYRSDGGRTGADVFVTTMSTP